MCNIAAYTLSSGIFLLAGYLAYKWLLSTENQPGLNRILLLTIYFAAIVLPLLPAIDLVAHHDAGQMAGIAPEQLQGYIIEAGSTIRWKSAIFPYISITILIISNICRAECTNSVLLGKLAAIKRKWI